MVTTILPGGSHSAQDALEVYRRGYIVRLIEALGDTYEAVWWVSGDDEFFLLAKQFVLAYPSKTYNLSSYGEEFPAFLRETCPFPDIPFLPFLADFEWMFKNIFHMPQHQTVSQETIQEITQQGNIRFQFGPSVQLFTSPFAVYDIWKLRGTCQTGQHPNDWNHTQRLLLYKKNEQIFVNELQDNEFSILHKLLTAQTLEDALNEASKEFPEMNQEQISQLFQVIVHTGIIQHVSAAC